jgi:ABC-2 type transport system permease protein
LRSPDSRSVLALWLVVLRKEMRELCSSRSWWLLLLVTGALVGHAFITATSTYAEASGAGGGPAALSQGLSPLGGMVVPVLGAYDLAATLLLPFVVIRMFAVERDTGALMLVLQWPLRLRAVMAAKAAALMAGWLVAGIPGALALVWWHSMGGHLSSAEVATVALGHLLRGAMTIGIGAAAAALASSASSAAILALTVTLGTWALDYAAAARGGWLQAAAQYTPSAALRVFEQGELRASVVLVMLIVTIGGLGACSAWLQASRPFRQRIVHLASIVALTFVAAFGSANVRTSRDISEDRRNSFPPADEAALRSLRSPLVVTVHLAAEDPRLTDLEHGVFAKLRRVMSSSRFIYQSRGRSGLFEREDDHYGEIWYAVGGRQAMSRSATPEIVLETIYEVAGIRPPPSEETPSYPGYPLTTTPSHASLVFFALWPACLVLAWWLIRRPRAARTTIDSEAVAPAVGSA